MIKTFNEYLLNEGKIMYKEFWTCELKDDKDLEEQANKKEFEKDKEILAFLKKGGYKGKLKLNYVEIETIPSGEDIDFDRNITKSKTVEI